MDGIALVIRYVTGIQWLVTRCESVVVRDGTKFGGKAIIKLVI
jgi:hypothetical protein